jgi:lipoprotein-anchoring transpeptidase ErfK/SrfK
LEPVLDEDLAPISADVPAGEKRIEISLALQSLTAFEGDQVVLRTQISSGVRNSGAAGLPTETPTGTFNVNSKLPAKYMGDNRLTDTLGDRYLPGVPWTLFFAEGGYAIHGAYWHNNFGAPMSRGCVNMRPADAQWLYRWVTPVAGADEWEARGQGTRVVVS